MLINEKSQKDNSEGSSPSVGGGETSHLSNDIYILEIR
jgi:hypothetical protein